jgi:hypothetical protein
MPRSAGVGVLSGSDAEGVLPVGDVGWHNLRESVVVTSLVRLTLDDKPHLYSSLSLAKVISLFRGEQQRIADAGG